jgi:hypothetical protein
MIRSLSLMLGFTVVLAACGPKESGRKQHLEFQGFTVEEGVYKPKPGWTFTAETGGKILARMNTGGGGIIITPCECALEGSGECHQASSDNPDGTIGEIWCEDIGCGFCVGGVAEPDELAPLARFNVVCKARQT